MSELRVSRALRDNEATLPADGTHIYLTDTLESPPLHRRNRYLFVKPMAEQHAKGTQSQKRGPSHRLPRQSAL